MTSHQDTGGRSAQKRRTREAIVAAAARVLTRGAAPSIDEIAAEADVSRRTIYMYFPTLEQLLIDATLASMSEAKIGAVLDRVEGDADVPRRVEALTRAVQREFASTEPHGRRLIRLTVDADPGDRPADEPRRGYRRIEWIERAVAPLRDRLTPSAFERLVSALAMVIGWESLLVARDIRALSLKDAENVSAWAATTLVSAALAEAGPINGKRPRNPAARRLRKTRRP